ncbi:MAG: hypothetical protein L6R35_000461 [Caloplaca aegaea]|nr:MAG: hypothetical protein L6R35_000461 [Caloplaca aegaea]
MEVQGNAYIRSLQSPLQDCDCMILGGDIFEAFRSTGSGSASYSMHYTLVFSAHYFSTHGCRFWDSLGAAALDEEAPLAAAAVAAAALALLSKKLAIIQLKEFFERGDTVYFSLIILRQETVA